MWASAGAKSPMLNAQKADAKRPGDDIKPPQDPKRRRAALSNKALDEFLLRQQRKIDNNEGGSREEQVRHSANLWKAMCVTREFQQPHVYKKVLGHVSEECVPGEDWLTGDFLRQYVFSCKHRQFECFYCMGGQRDTNPEEVLQWAKYMVGTEGSPTYALGDSEQSKGIFVLLTRTLNGAAASPENNCFFQCLKIVAAMPHCCLETYHMALIYAKDTGSRQNTLTLLQCIFERKEDQSKLMQAIFEFTTDVQDQEVLRFVLENICDMPAGLLHAMFIQTHSLLSEDTVKFLPSQVISPKANEWTPLTVMLLVFTLSAMNDCDGMRCRPFNCDGVRCHDFAIQRLKTTLRFLTEKKRLMEYIELLELMLVDSVQRDVPQQASMETILRAEKTFAAVCDSFPVAEACRLVERCSEIASTAGYNVHSRIRELLQEKIQKYLCGVLRT